MSIVIEYPNFNVKEFDYYHRESEKNNFKYVL